MKNQLRADESDQGGNQEAVAVQPPGETERDSEISLVRQHVEPKSGRDSIRRQKRRTNAVTSSPIGIGRGKAIQALNRAGSKRTESVQPKHGLEKETK